MSAVVLSVQDVSKRFRNVQAVQNVSLEVRAGRILGLVGGSGSGKSTLANLLLGLEQPDAGAIVYRGQAMDTLDRPGRRAFRADVQMVFQDPFASLNPRFTVMSTVAEPLIVQRRGNAQERSEAVLRALGDAGLRPPEQFVERYPHELSGGQRQRVAIARAIVLNPSVLVADEPVSMLDVSIRNGILRLLRRFAQVRQMAIVFITHDLSLLGSLCDDVAVMHEGRIIETGTPRQIVLDPSQAYTKRLLAAVPRL